MTDGYVNMRREDLKLSPSLLGSLMVHDFADYVADAVADAWTDDDEPDGQE